MDYRINWSGTETVGLYGITRTGTGVVVVSVVLSDLVETVVNYRDQ